MQPGPVEARDLLAVHIDMCMALAGLIGPRGMLRGEAKVLGLHLQVPTGHRVGRDVDLDRGRLWTRGGIHQCGMIVRGRAGSATVVLRIRVIMPIQGDAVSCGGQKSDTAPKHKANGKQSKRTGHGRSFSGK